MAGDDTYLRHVLRVHEADIRQFNPGFVHDPFAGDPSYLVLKGDETVGAVILRDAGAGAAAAPRLGDAALSRLLTGGVRLRVRGSVPPARLPSRPDADGMVDPYYERLGFRREGDAFVL